MDKETQRKEKNRQYAKARYHRLLSEMSAEQLRAFREKHCARVKEYTQRVKASWTEEQKAHDRERHSVATRKHRANLSAEDKERRLEQAREWKRNHIEMVRENRTKHYSQNKDQERIRTIKWREQNHERVRELDNAWRHRNKTKISERRKAPEIKMQRNAHALALYHGDIHKNIETRLRASFLQSLRRSLAHKTTSVKTLIGCSTEELVAHLEAKFLPGMSWDRRREIHIDHIRPVASFDMTDPEQQRACFHYTNLQPLWAADNIRKRDKWDANCLSDGQRPLVA